MNSEENVTRKIIIDNKEFEVKSCFGSEYILFSDRKETKGYPFEPFLFQKTIKLDEYGFAYLVDNSGIFWITTPHDDYKVLSRPCLPYCLDLIKSHENITDYKISELVKKAKEKNETFKKERQINAV